MSDNNSNNLNNINNNTYEDKERNSNDKMVSLFFEAGLLSRFKRSGFDFLGTGDQNIASHLYRTALIAFVLSKRLDANLPFAVFIALFHDLPEARMGDINYFQKQYTAKNELKAVEDLIRDFPEMEDLPYLIEEFNNGDSLEGKIARDSDCLELIITLKEELDKGNPQAEIWIKDALNRLELDLSKELAEIALSQKSYDWWMDIMRIKR